MATNSEIKIENGVPLPTNKARAAVYPWGGMKAGDSFYVPLNGRPHYRVQQTVANGARARFGKGGYLTKRDGDGIRVWRVK